MADRHRGQGSRACSPPSSVSRDVLPDDGDSSGSAVVRKVSRWTFVRRSHGLARAKSAPEGRFAGCDGYSAASFFRPRPLATGDPKVRLRGRFAGPFVARETCIGLVLRKLTRCGNLVSPGRDQSSPVSRSPAAVAQLAEHHVANVIVVGSNPISRSLLLQTAIALPLRIAADRSSWVSFRRIGRHEAGCPPAIGKFRVLARRDIATAAGNRGVADVRPRGLRYSLPHPHRHRRQGMFRWRAIRGWRR